MIKVKISKLVFFAILLSGLALLIIPTVYCTDTNSQDLQNELEDSVYEQLGNIDLTEFDEIIGNLDSTAQEIFNSTSFWDKVTNLLNGDFGGDFSTFIGAFFDCFFGELVNFIPLLCIIIAVTMLCSLIGNIRSDTGSGSMGKIIDFVCYGVVIVLITAAIVFVLDFALNILEYSLSNNIPTPNQQKPFIAPIVAGE